MESLGEDVAVGVGANGGDSSVAGQTSVDAPLEDGSVVGLVHKSDRLGNGANNGGAMYAKEPQERDERLEDNDARQGVANALERGLDPLVDELDGGNATNSIGNAVDNHEEGADNSSRNEAGKCSRNAVGHAGGHLDADVLLHEHAVDKTTKKTSKNGADHALASQPGLVEAGGSKSKCALYALDACLSSGNGVGSGSGHYAILASGNYGTNVVGDEDEERSKRNNASGEGLPAIVLCPRVANAYGADHSDNLERGGVAMAQVVNNRAVAKAGNKVRSCLDGELEQQQVNSTYDNKRHGKHHAVFDRAYAARVHESHEQRENFILQKIAHSKPFPFLSFFSFLKDL